MEGVAGVKVLLLLHMFEYCGRRVAASLHAQYSRCVDCSPYCPYLSFSLIASSQHPHP